MDAVCLDVLGTPLCVDELCQRGLRANIVSAGSLPRSPDEPVDRKDILARNDYNEEWSPAGEANGFTVSKTG
jgi:hypothetical protein